MRRLRKTAPGFTLIELIVATAILMVLASAALPLARVQMRRYREVELRKTLRDMRTAIDNFKLAADRQQISPTELRLGNEGYPASLQQMVDGVARANDASGTKLKFLRRIPIDPVTGQADWNMRSYQDPPEATVWGGQNVFDVSSKAQGVGLDGTKYKDW